MIKLNRLNLDLLMLDQLKVDMLMLGVLNGCILKLELFFFWCAEVRDIEYDIINLDILCGDLKHTQLGSRRAKSPGHPN